MWKERLPNYSVYFHDNYAVDALMEQSNWPEFPQLSLVLKCFQMKSAMLIDLWRQLVLYQFGGFYSDMDVMPGPNYTSDTVPPNVDFFSLSDGAKRPSQWHFGMSPHHPVAYYSVLEILKRVLDLPDITKPNLVFTTGPDALKHAYGKCFSWSKDHDIFADGVYHGCYNTTARKIGHEHYDEYVYQTINDMVEVNVPGQGMRNMTVRQQLKHDAGQKHWTEQQNDIRLTVSAISCWDHLYQLEQQ